MEWKCSKHSELRNSVAVVINVPWHIDVISIKIKKMYIFFSFGIHFWEHFSSILLCYVLLTQNRHISCFTENNYSFITLKILTLFFPHREIIYPSFLKNRLNMQNQQQVIPQHLWIKFHTLFHKNYMYYMTQTFFIIQVLSVFQTYQFSWNEKHIDV